MPYRVGRHQSPAMPGKAGDAACLRAQKRKAWPRALFRATRHGIAVGTRLFVAAFLCRALNNGRLPRRPPGTVWFARSYWAFLYQYTAPGSQSQTYRKNFFPQTGPPRPPDARSTRAARGFWSAAPSTCRSCCPCPTTPTTWSRATCTIDGPRRGVWQISLAGTLRRD